MPKKSFADNLAAGIKKRAGSAFTTPYKGLNINWLRLKYYKHLPPGKIRSHRLFGNHVYFTNAQEFLHGLKEIFVDRLYDQQLPSSPFILDCGANIGLSVIFLKKNFPDAEIIAFEPDTRNFDLLQKNIRSFGLENVKLEKAAVWTEDCQLLFNTTGTMGSSITTEKGADTQVVEAIKLKNHLTRRVDFLKIDIEGAEYELLKDIRTSLHQVHNMFIEYHGTYSQQNELVEMLTMLSAEGFHFYIKEAANVYSHPLKDKKNSNLPFDIQLNIFCKRP